MVERWLVVQTQPRRERWAAENIVRLGFGYYLPQIQSMEIRRGVKVAKLEPLFPRHIFVRSDNGQWRVLMGTFGVAGVIMSGQQPGFMPIKEIIRLRATEDIDGICVLPELTGSDERFVKGAKVRITTGAFAGQTGVYDGQAPQERVRVLLDYMGRKTQVLIADEVLEQAV